MFDLTSAGLWAGVKKWVKIIFWVALGAVVNMLTQLWFGYKPHDLILHLGGIEFTITAAMINIALTGAWNGFLAGFVKWITTKADDARRQAGL